jgi:hypothetical protein
VTHTWDVRRFRPPGFVLFALTIAVGTLAWLAPIALLFAAPWIVAILWLSRRGGSLFSEDMPSLGELARRRLLR